MNSKVIFIDQPYFAVNAPSNNYRIYKRKKNGSSYYIQCKNKDDYSKHLKKYICGFYEYSRNEKKSYSSMLGYFMGDKKSDDIMIKNQMRREEMAMLKDGTFIKDNQIEGLQENWSNYLEDSNVNLAVLSFYQDYVDENINVKDLQKEIATKIMPKFLKYCGYDNPKSNLEWVVSLHCDRKNNYHFHIAWIEKNKCYKLKNNKLGHRYKLKLNDLERNFMKRQASIAIERSSLYKPALIEINKDLEKLQKYFNPKDMNFTLGNLTNIELEEKIVRLGYLLNQIRNTDKAYIKYNSLPNNEIGNEIKYLTKEIKEQLFSSSDDLKLAKREIKESINKLNDIFIDIDKRNNISNIGFESVFENKLIKYKLEKSDNYILNAIVNHALYNYDINNKKIKNIKVEDLINEIAINIYNQKEYKLDYKKYSNRKKLRKKILENYFIDRGYKVHDKMSGALRRLSKDSDKAAREFYKMLLDDKIQYDKEI